MAVPLFTVAQSRPQSVDLPIDTEAALALALCDPHRDAESKRALLASHPQLVTIDLWSELSNRAAAAYYNQPAEACLEAYRVATDVAARLHNSKLQATTYYNMGR